LTYQERANNHLRLAKEAADHIDADDEFSRREKLITHVAICIAAALINSLLAIAVRGQAE